MRVSEISFGSPDVCKDPLSEAPENNYFSGNVVGPGVSLGSWDPTAGLLRLL